MSKIILHAWQLQFNTSHCIKQLLFNSVYTYPHKLRWCLYPGLQSFLLTTSLPCHKIMTTKTWQAPSLTYFPHPWWLRQFCLDMPKQQSHKFCKLNNVKFQNHVNHELVRVVLQVAVKKNVTPLAEIWSLVYENYHFESWKRHLVMHVDLLKNILPVSAVNY